MNTDSPEPDRIGSLNKNLRNLQLSYSKLGEDIAIITEQIRSLELELVNTNTTKPKRVKSKHKKLSLDN